MRSQGEVHRHRRRPPVERGLPAVCGLAGDGKLGACKKAVLVRSGGAEQIAVKAPEFKFATFRILAPRNKKSPSTRVVGVCQKSEPMEPADTKAARSDRAELPVKIRGVVERVALHEDSHVGHAAITLSEVVEVCLRFSSGIGEGDAAGCSVAFVINGDAENRGDAPQPCEALVMPRDNEFERRCHGGTKDAAAVLAAQTIWGILLTA